MNDDSEEAEATRAALRRLAEDGSDLSKPMTIDFFVAVPSESAGEDVARRAQGIGFSTRVFRDDDSANWTCSCTRTLIPEFTKVRAIERELDAIARPSGGYSDGFGSFGNAER